MTEMVKLLILNLTTLTDIPDEIWNKIVQRVKNVFLRQNNSCRQYVFSVQGYQNLTEVLASDFVSPGDQTLCILVTSNRGRKEKTLEDFAQANMMSYFAGIGSKTQQILSVYVANMIDGRINGLSGNEDEVEIFVPHLFTGGSLLWWGEDK